MTWLVARLHHRFSLKKAVQTPNNDTGGFDRSYEELTQFWGELKPVTLFGRGIEYVRNVQNNKNVTHIASVRRLTIAELSQEFASAFGVGYDNVSDMGTPKTEWFLFLDKGGVKTRMFRVDSVINVNERDEYLGIRLIEVEESGTGGWA